MPRAASWTFIAKDKFTATAKKIASSTRRMKINFKSAGAAAVRMGNKIKAVGKRMRVMSAIAGVAVAISLKNFASMEAGLTNVLTLLSDSEVNKFGAKLAKMSEGAIKHGFSIDDTTKALFDTVSALGANEKAFVTFHIAQKLAIGGVTELSVAVDGITSLMNAYKSQNVEATEIAQAFFAAQVKGKVTVAELSANIGKVAPIAKAAGVGYKELLAAMSQLTLGGISVEESSTALKGLFTALLKPSKEAKTILKALNVPFGATALRASSLAEIMSRLNKVQEKFPDFIALAIPNIRALTAVLALDSAALENMDGIVKAINFDIANGTGLFKAYARQLTTLKEKTSIAKGTFAAISAEIGAIFLPVALKVLEMLMGLAGWWSTLGDGMKKFVAWTTAAATVASTMAASLAVLFIVAGKGAIILGIITGFFTLIPLMVAALVAVLIKLGYEIYKNFDAVKQGWESVKNFFSFGGDEADAEITKKLEAEIGGKSTIQLDATIHDPGGNVKSSSMKSTSTGNGPKLGTNLVTQS